MGLATHRPAAIGASFLLSVLAIVSTVVPDMDGILDGCHIQHDIFQQLKKESAKLDDAVGKEISGARRSILPVSGWRYAMAMQAAMGVAAACQLVALTFHAPSSAASFIITMLCAILLLGDACYVAAVVAARAYRLRQIALQVFSKKSIKVADTGPDALSMVAAKMSPLRIWVVESSTAVTDLLLMRMVRHTARFSKRALIGRDAAAPAPALSPCNQSMTQAATIMNGLGCRVRNSPLKVLVAILNITFVADGVMEYIYPRHGVGYGLALQDIPIAGVATAFTCALMAMVTMSDFVRKHIRPEEYSAGLVTEHNRLVFFRRRAHTVARIHHAMAPPPSRIIIQELREAIAQGEAIDAEFPFSEDVLDLAVAREHLLSALEADESRVRYQERLCDLMKNAPHDRDIDALLVNLQKAREAGAEQRFIIAAAQALQEAFFLQSRLEYANARLEFAAHDPLKGGPYAGTMIDTKELTAAITHARDSGVMASTIEAAERKVVDATFTQRGEGVSAGKAQTAQRAKATTAWRRRLAERRVEQAEDGVRQALHALSRREPADLLKSFLTELTEGLSDARAAKWEQYFLDQHLDAHAGYSKRLQRHEKARQALEWEVNVARDTIGKIECFTDAAVHEQLRKLAMAVEEADKAFVDEGDLHMAHAVHHDIQSVLTLRERANARLASTLARVPDKVWDIMADREARVEVFIAIARAKKVRVEHVKLVDAAACIVRAGLARLSQTKSSEMLALTVPGFASSIADARAAAVDDEMLLPANRLLQTAQDLLQRHHHAQVRLVSTMATLDCKSQALRGVRSKCEDPRRAIEELKEAAKELEGSIMAAGEVCAPDVSNGLEKHLQAWQQIRQALIHLHHDDLWA